MFIALKFSVASPHPPKREDYFTDCLEVNFYEYLLIYFLGSAGELQINLVCSLNNSFSMRQDVI